MAWTSPDGLTWSPHTIDSAEATSFGNDAAASDGKRVIAFAANGASTWASDDGIEWIRHDVESVPVGFEAVAGGERGFIAMGLDQDETAYYAWLSP
jgi:hypothetical protein